VLHIDNVPAPQHSGMLYGLQLGVNLYDEALGQFYGNTCYSMVEPLQDVQQQQEQQQQEQQQQQEHLAEAPGQHPPVDFSCDVMFHSAISDPHCIAVVSRLAPAWFCSSGPCMTWL
jgi:nephrocystin-4